MRGGYRGKPKQKLPSHLKRVHVNARIQRWMLDELSALSRGLLSDAYSIVS